MKDTIRDSFFGQCCRLVTNGRIFNYQEEIDSSVWQRYIHNEKSAGQVQTPETSLETGAERDNGNASSSSCSTTSSLTAAELGQQRDHAIHDGDKGHSVDQEKGKDPNIVDWYGPDDPEASRHWLQPMPRVRVS